MPRKGGHLLYPWGNGPVTGKRANECDWNCPKAFDRGDPRYTLEVSTLHPDNGVDDGWAATAPVASYPAGRSRWGLWDMAGNVSEWTDTEDPLSTPEYREIRGGSWRDMAWRLETSFRSRTNHGDETIGFRCAVEPDKP